MRIKLLKAHALNVRKLKKGTEARVSNDVGRELVKREIAIELDRPTKEETITKKKLKAEKD